MTLDDDAPAIDREPQDGLPALTPEIVEDEEQLGVAVDAVILADPEARRRSAEIATHCEWLKAAVDDGAWKLILEIEARDNERFGELVLVIATWSFNEGRRFPIAPSPRGAP